MSKVSRSASFLRSLRAIAWSFVGIRKSSEFQEDMNQVGPFEIIAAGLLGVLVLVSALIVLVRWVVAQ